MTRAPDLSALIVNFNGGPMLAQSVERLEEAAAGLDIEILIADNGSTDDSLLPFRRRLQNESSSGSSLRLLELGENLGFGAANNRAAAEASSDSLLLINSDAWPKPGSLESLIEQLEADPANGLVAPRLVYPDGRHQFHWAPTTSILGETLQIIRNRFETRALTHRLRLGRGWFTAACLLIRRQAFESVGGFDEGFFLYFEDVDLCLRLRQAGWRLVEAPDATVVHVKGGSQGGATLEGPSEVHYRHGQLRYYAHHRPAWENAVIRRKLRRKFLKSPEPQRSRLLALLD